MRITGVETIPLSYEMPYPLTYARGEYQTRDALLVKVHTSDPDIFGWGESAMWGGPHAVSAAVIEREIAPLIVGEDPRRPEYLWEKVYQSTYYHGRKGILLACLSGVDIALWDIVGKCAASRCGGSSAASAVRSAHMPRPATTAATMVSTTLLGRCRQGARRRLPRLQDEDRQHPAGRPCGRPA